jgi:hypothetical protein
MFPSAQCLVCLGAGSHLPQRESRVPLLLTTTIPSGFVGHSAVRSWLWIGFPGSRSHSYPAGAVSNSEVSPDSVLKSRHVDWNLVTRVAGSAPTGELQSRACSSHGLQARAAYRVWRDIRYSAANPVFFSPAATRFRISAICSDVREGLRPL